MNEKHQNLGTRLKRLGFSQGNQMKLYGQDFEFISDPIIMTDHLVLLDATEKKTGELRRVRVPLPILAMAGADRPAA
jgi:hypothetical protein